MFILQSNFLTLGQKSHVYKIISVVLKRKTKSPLFIYNLILCVCLGDVMWELLMMMKCKALTWRMMWWSPCIYRQPSPTWSSSHHPRYSYSSTTEFPTTASITPSVRLSVLCNCKFRELVARTWFGFLLGICMNNADDISANGGFGMYNLLSLYFYFCACSPGTSIYLLYSSQIFNTARKKNEVL